VQARVVAATHVDLEAAVARADFRRDLYYRLAGAVVTTPPLRAHPSDIPALASAILDGETANFGACALSDEALAALVAHPWPGNVRELRNLLRRAAAMHGPNLGVGDLALPATQPQAIEEDVVRVVGRAYLDIEKDVLASAIRRHRGNKRAAAASLQIPKSTLCDKAKRYHLVAEGDE
jgi:transcriptional regulator with PAS, ATPase and Fis domain